MAAPLGFKTFTTGDVLTAADTNGYLMQGVWTFASAAARDAAVTSPQEGNICYLKDTDAVMTYSGAAWATVGGATSFVGCRLTKSADQTVTQNVYTAVTWNTETFDTSAFHDTVTNNSRITIPSGRAGYYQFTAQISMTQSNYSGLAIYKNGALAFRTSPLGSQPGLASANYLANLIVTDYIEVFVYNTNATPIVDGVTGATGLSTFTAQYLGA